MGCFPMISSMLSLITILLVTSSLSQISNAQNSPQDYLDAHNRARSEVGVGPIRWDTTVATYARNYANTLRGDCDLVHSEGPYGENLAWYSDDMTAATAVNMWVSEKSSYDYNSNTCVGGECRHYTQVVWRNSVRLGCAKVRSYDGRRTIISCNYDPPGNYINQRPFDIDPFRVPLSFNNDLDHDN